MNTIQSIQFTRKINYQNIVVMQQCKQIWMVFFHDKHKVLNDCSANKSKLIMLQVFA